MKKFFFLAAAATLTFAACNKTDVVYDNGPQEIAMFAVNNVATKTPVDGNTFLPTDDMAVAAYIVKGSVGDFFGNTSFRKETGATYWTGDPARYWPLSTSTINFLAVTKTGGGASNSQVELPSPYASKAIVTLNDNSAYNQNDLMFAAAQGNHVQGGGYSAVSMVFKHALSWINFQIKKVDADGYDLVINSIKLNGARYSGTLNLTNDQYKTTEAQTTDEITAKWTDGEVKDNVSVPNSDGTSEAVPVTLTTEYQLFGNGILVVPGGAKSFTINYTLTQKDGPANTYDYVYTLPEGTSWEMAKKYFYNISFDLTEIEVDPYVTTWDASHANVNSGVELK